MALAFTAATDGGLDTVSFFVPGTPAPQGSKRHVGRGVMVESSKAVGPWRERVALAAHQTLNGQPMFDKGVALEVVVKFVMPRPASTPKHSTPFAVKRPDIDKLIRAVHDALTGVVFPDDSAVVQSHAYKYLAELGHPAGAHIRINAFRKSVNA